MSININCKKKWHPSRYETQKEVEKIKNQNSKKLEYDNKRENEHIRNVLSHGDNVRMSWMFD